MEDSILCPKCGFLSRSGVLCDACGFYCSEKVQMAPIEPTINLFNIEPYIIDTGKFDNLLHGSVVRQFEQEFCQYVGAKYACSTSSATAAIFLSLHANTQAGDVLEIPSVLPPVVANAIHHAELEFCFVDNVDWVGWSYILHKNGGGSKIIDSAQRVDRNQYAQEANDDDLMIFSFYPTKPVGSCDGGIIVSNNWEKIRWLKEASMNGTSFSNSSWTRHVSFRGWKMYMNSVQAQIALNNLRKLDDKKKKLLRIRDFYNHKLGLNNISDHLYRISVPDNDAFIQKMKRKNTVCGKHYEPLHLMLAYSMNRDRSRMFHKNLANSEHVGRTTVSIPFHEKLTVNDICKTLKSVKEVA